MSDTKELHPKEIEHLDKEMAFLDLKMKETELLVRAREKQLREQEANSWEHRVFEFTGTVNAVSVSNAIDCMGSWSRLDPGCDIEIVFTSPGGSIFDGLAFYDFVQDLKDSGHKVTTRARGWVASMAGVLLQAGTERTMAPNSYLMIHEPLRVAFLEVIKASEMKDDAILFDRLWTKCCDILGERSTMTQRQIKNKAARKDWWLDPAEAVRLGFADRVE